MDRLYAIVRGGVLGSGVARGLMGGGEMAPLAAFLAVAGLLLVFFKLLTVDFLPEAAELQLIFGVLAAVLFHTFAVELLLLSAAAEFAP